MRSDRRLCLLTDALSLIDSTSVSDRQKLIGLRDMIVPELVSKGYYSAKFYKYKNDNPPPMAHTHTMERIRTNLQLLLDKEKSYYAV